MDDHIVADPVQIRAAVAAAHRTQNLYPPVYFRAVVVQGLEQAASLPVFFHGITMQGASWAKMGKACWNKAGCIPRQGDDHPVKRVRHEAKCIYRFAQVQMHPAFVSVDLHIFNGTGMCLFIQFNPVYFLGLAVAGNAEETGACTGAEHANAFPGLHLLCQTEPLAGQPGGKIYSSQIHKEGNAVFPVQGGQPLFSSHHVHADKALRAAVISLTQSHYPDMPVQAENGLADTAGCRMDGMGQGEERYIADGVKTAWEQIGRDVR